MQTPTIETITTINTENMAAPPHDDAAKRTAGVVPRAFWTAKAGNAHGDYEDAYALGDDCLAIADGATESSFARMWALALAEGFVSDPSAVLPCTTERLQTWCAPLQKTWTEAVPWNTLPWFAEDKARSGAFATLLGLQFIPSEESGDAERSGDVKNSLSSTSPLPHASTPLRSWRAFAIGDSCFFQIREGVLKRAFPLEHSAQFDSRPILLSSNPANNKRVWDDVMVMEGDYQAGDILVFATDALAKWFLARVEAGVRPWDALCGLTSQEEFDTFVTHLRQDRVMRNDDVTLVIVGGARGTAEPEPLAALTPTSESILSESVPPVLYAGTLPEPSPPEETGSDPNGITQQETTNAPNGLTQQETSLALAAEQEAGITLAPEPAQEVGA